ncbi:UNVERIFIED_CONTAM: hypothetical protein GTU68_013526 [Idotea baltica]|nr:hypothetical protein [Idotea baltica]
MGSTLFDKIWDRHVVEQVDEKQSILYIDQHFIHEVTSPQAFDGLRKRKVPVFNTRQTTGTADHNVPTIDQHLPIAEPLSRKQVQQLSLNCKEFGVELFDLSHPKQGIVHVIGPEQGLTRPGMTIVCGDSHTSTHGAFGCIAFGIGTSEVEQVLASQSVLQVKPKQMRIVINGTLAPGVSSKDIILYVIAKLGVGGATGHFVEYAGNTIEELSMEARMTVCNMSIEMGARGGLIAPDDTTFEYLAKRKEKIANWDVSLEYYKALVTDQDATFDIVHEFDAADISPMITYGTNPGMGIKIDATIPNHVGDSFTKSLNYMGLSSGQGLLDMPIDYVFIGSCTNSRIEDLREVAEFIKGKKKSDSVKVFVVPGSQKVAIQAKEEGLDKILEAAGFELRGAGCSACLGMNEDKIPEGKYCVSTSNRNFEGRQGPGARTLLASPLTAAAAAISGKIVDVRKELV